MWDELCILKFSHTFIYFFVVFFFSIGWILSRFSVPDDPSDRGSDAANSPEGGADLRAGHISGSTDALPAHSTHRHVSEDSFLFDRLRSRMEQDTWVKILFSLIDSDQEWNTIHCEILLQNSMQLLSM